MVSYTFFIGPKHFGKLDVMVKEQELKNPFEK